MTLYYVSFDPTPGKREKNAWYCQVRVKIWAPHMASAVIEMGWGEMKVSPDRDKISGFSLVFSGTTPAGELGCLVTVWQG